MNLKHKTGIKDPGITGKIDLTMTDLAGRGVRIDTKNTASQLTGMEVSTGGEMFTAVGNSVEVKPCASVQQTVMCHPLQGSKDHLSLPGEVGLVQDGEGSLLGVGMEGLAQAGEVGQERAGEVELMADQGAGPIIIRGCPAGKVTHILISLIGAQTGMGIFKEICTVHHQTVVLGGERMLIIFSLVMNITERVSLTTEQEGSTVVPFTVEGLTMDGVFQGKGRALVDRRAGIRSVVGLFLNPAD